MIYLSETPKVETELKCTRSLGTSSRQSKVNIFVRFQFILREAAVLILRV